MEFIKKVSESRLFTLKSFDRLVYNLTHRVLRIYNFNKYKHKIILRGGAEILRLCLYEKENFIKNYRWCVYALFDGVHFL